MDILITAICSFFVGILVYLVTDLFCQPSITVENKTIQDRATSPHIFVKNTAHLFTAYEVVCYLYYYVNGKKQPILRRGTKPIPRIESKGGKNRIGLLIHPQDERRVSMKKNEFFTQDGNHIDILVIGQNRFGRKSVLCTQTLKIEIDEEEKIGKNTN